MKIEFLTNTVVKKWSNGFFALSEINLDVFFDLFSFVLLSNVAAIS
jgi:hypothetical protein